MRKLSLKIKQIEIKLIIFIVSFFAGLISKAQNQVVVFSGENSYIQIPHLQVPEKFTIEAWISSKQKGIGTILAWKDLNSGTFDGDASLFRIENGYLQYGEWINNSWIYVNANRKTNFETPTHVAVVRYNDNVFFYINGEAAGKRKIHSTPICQTDCLTIGAILINKNESFIGTIDELRIWSKIRSEEEIRKNYQSDIIGSEDRLWGYWKFEKNLKDKTLKLKDGIGHGIVFKQQTLFEKKSAQITTIYIAEKTKTIPAFYFNCNQKGKLFWKKRKKGSAPPKRQEILKSTHYYYYSTPSKEAAYAINLTREQINEYDFYILFQNRMKQTTKRIHLTPKL